MKIQTPFKQTLSETRENTKELNNLQLFIAGFLFDPNCTYRYLVQDVINIICNATTVQNNFSYIHAFDQRGVLSWIRNSFQSKTVINREKVIEFQRYTVYSYYLRNQEKFIYHIDRSRSVEILGQKLETGSFKPPLEHGDRYYVIDLQNYELQLTHVTICLNYGYASGLRLYGSKERIIRNKYQTNTSRFVGLDYLELNLIESSSEKGGSSITHTFSIINLSEFYRYIIIDSTRDFRIPLSGLEMYGHIR